MLFAWALHGLIWKYGGLFGCWVWVFPGRRKQMGTPWHHNEWDPHRWLCITWVVWTTTMGLPIAGCDEPLPCICMRMELKRDTTPRASSVACLRSCIHAHMPAALGSKLCPGSWPATALLTSAFVLNMPAKKQVSATKGHCLPSTRLVDTIHGSKWVGMGIAIGGVRSVPPYWSALM